jgi:ATP-dependent helicase HrpB
MLDPLPIDQHLDTIRDRVREHRAVVVVAPPGAGKTTRVPPALADDGPVIVLQPRRLAARSLARRIAAERGWTLGEESGWHVRFDRRFSSATRVLVATEGILTARLQSDPLLTGFRTVVVDEFHERSIHADLALALARQAWLARGDLRIVVMSATLDAEPVAAFLGDAPVVRVEGRQFLVDVAYAPGLATADAIRAELAREGGDVLVFLPGVPEIARAARALSSGSMPHGVRVVPLSGRSSPEEQDEALAPSSARRVILATNVAETSITVPGVTTVIDTGLHKVPRLDAALGLDRLETERISLDSADQRAGRAGRTAPGRALRLWDPRDVMRPHREPEIERIDLAPPVLDVLAWGGNPTSFEWFQAPPAESLVAALGLLSSLGAVADGRLTPRGDLLRRLPVPPRLARVLVAAGGSSLSVAACTVLSERFSPPGALPSGTSDVIARADRLGGAPPAIRRAAEEIASATRRVLDDRAFASVVADAKVEGGDDESIVRRALLTGFPDRLARRRSAGSPRVVLASGHGGVLDRQSVVVEGEFLLALDVEAGERGPGAEARVRLASRVEREWLPPTTRRVEHRFDPATGAVRATEVERVFELAIGERTVPADPAQAFALLVPAFVARGVTPDQAPIAARLRFAGIDLDLHAVAQAACAGRTTLAALDLASSIDDRARRELSRLAPETVPLPSGRSAKLVYRDDGTVVASVKLQELFGLADSPKVGAAGTPVVFELLAPNGRPVQTTRDLRSFWDRTYPEVRKELRARYPKHPWPEDPWTASASHRPKPRRDGET